MFYLKILFKEEEVRDFLTRKGYTFKKTKKLQLPSGRVVETSCEVEYAVKGEEHGSIVLMFENEQRKKALEI